MDHSISRRGFFKGSVVVAMGAASAYVLGSCAPQTAGTQEEKTAEAAKAAAGKPVMLHRGYGSAHGERGFTQVAVAVAQDGTILAANVDDYEFVDAGTEGFTGVPNADAGFGEGFAAGKLLISKADNNDAYSARMKEKAQATQTWQQSMDAIVASLVGKKAADVDTADAISGATLVDAPNYAKLIVEVAGDDALAVEGSLGEGDVKIGRANGAAHGEKAFADAAVLVQGDVVVAASIDEFQFMDASTAGIEAVPNADAAFGEGFAEGKVLVSKSVNSDVYSEHMKEKAQATQAWIESMKAIEGFVAGKKEDDLKNVGADAVSGATLVDAAGYVGVAEKAARNA